MKNKKILILHSSNDLYGASKIFLQITHLLNSKGYQVHVVLPSKGPLDNFIHNDVFISYFNLGVFRKKYLNFFGIINRIVRIYKAIFFLKSYIIINKIDLVYTNTSVIWASGFVSKFLKKPSVYHIHEIPFGSLIYKHISRFVLNLISDSVICVSNAVLIYWKKNIKKSKLIRIYNGILRPKVLKKNLCNKKIVLTNVSRITPYKGHKYLIEIFKELVLLESKFELLIVGDFSQENEKYFKELKVLASNYKLENKIQFLGFKNNINKILSKSNFFIHSAVNPDPLPTVLFESLYSNTPTISTNLGGSPEILDYGNNGLLIPFDHKFKSAKLIYDYSKDFNKQKLHLKNANMFLKINYGQKIFEKNILNAINKLLNE